MGFFKKLIKTTVDVAGIPLAIGADVVTLGGLMTDKKEPYSAGQAKTVLKDLQKLYDELDD